MTFHPFRDKRDARDIVTRAVEEGHGEPVPVGDLDDAFLHGRRARKARQAAIAAGTLKLTHYRRPWREDMVTPMPDKKGRRR